MKKLALLLLLVGACVRQVELTPAPDARDDDAAIGIPPDGFIVGVDGDPDACPCTPDADGTHEL